MFYIIRDFLSYYTPTPPEGVYCFTSVHPSVRRRYFSSHFSQQLLMAEILYLVTTFIQVYHIVGSVFGTVRFLLPVYRLSWFLYTLNIYAGGIISELQLNTSFYGCSMLLRSLILIGIYYIIREFLYCYGCSILLGMSMLLRSPILLGNFYIIILLGIFYFNRDFFLYHYGFVFLYYQEFSVLFGIAYIFFLQFFLFHKWISYIIRELLYY